MSAGLSGFRGQSVARLGVSGYRSRVNPLRTSLLLLAFAALTVTARAQFVITEFMANNVANIIDEDGSHEDWIEIYNSGLSAASLNGWYLTDSAGQLRKWAFPDKTLQPGQYLVVFASNKDRRNPLANLHTNFKLGSSGGFLGLTKAETGGSTTVVQSWNPYPPQAADVSYGLSNAGSTTPLVTAASAVKWRVPDSTTGPAMGTAWRGGNEPFSETGWSSGFAALGNAGVPVPAIVGNGALELQHRYNSSETSTTWDTSTYTRIATSNSAAFLASSTDTAISPLKRNGVLNYVGTENDQFLISVNTSTLNTAYNVPSSTVCFWMKANPPTGAGNSGAMLWDRRPNSTTPGMVIVQQDNGTLLLQSNNGYCSLANPASVSDNQWHHIAVTMNTAAGQAVTIYVDGVQVATANNSAAWGWTTNQPIEIGRSHDTYWKRYNGLMDDNRFYSRLLTATEIAQIANGADTTMGTTLFSTKGVDSADITTTITGMVNTNPTAYVRIPFTVADPAVISGVLLTVRQADGCVAWINGNQVASYNAPASPVWNSPANSAQDPGRFRLTTVSVAAGGLHAGTNILAIQLLNNTTTEPNVLLRPTLDAISSVSGLSVYFTTATPGATNSGPLTAIGPHISNSTNNSARPVGGAGSAALTISTKVLPVLHPIATVQVAYRVMWGAETLVPMTAAGGGIYTANIPTSGLNPGDMLRWRIVATDTANTPTTDPLFINLDATPGPDTDQYYGTVAQDGGYTTQLPVLYWFVQNENAAATAAGTQCSVFYLGRFYDYVSVNIHGQSTQGFPKKSYNLNFNKGNHFTWAAGQAAIGSVNLITDYADKSKLRNTLAYAAFADTHHAASHFSNMLHVRQATGSAPAAAFYGIYDLVEDGSEEFIARCGLDGQGALYKMYNSLESTAGAEKKTRKFEDMSDLQALIDGVNPNTRSLAQRRQYVYDNVNIPAMINLCATQSMILDTDWGHKNYYVYRDTLGTKEWYTLPWDEDLSFGHTFTGAQNYFDDDLHSQGGLMVGVNGNYLMTIVAAAPELNAMFVRRMRTLMEQLLVSSTATNGIWDNRVTALINQIDPPGAAYLTDADRELQKWGFWIDGDATQRFTGTLDAATHDHGARMQAMRILNSNPNPPQTSSINNPELGNTTFAFLPGRRSILFTQNPTNNGLGVPASQPASPALTIEQIDFNPASGNQDEEFFVIRNNSGDSVDLTGWHLTGAVDFTFPGGCIVPAYTNGTDNIGLLHVAKSPAAFRVRTSGATGGQYRFVVGPYSGSLSARGGTIELRRPDNTLLTSQTWTPAPTAAQNQLRVSELNYSPASPSAAEAAAIPGVHASDFEFIELVNTGGSALSLGGARFVKGIDFTFPLGATLAAGARVVLVSNQPAFQYRYGNGATVGGQYLGNLSNSGDTLQLLDSQGEEVLNFHYEPSWFPQSDGLGYTLVARNAAPDWLDYGTPSAPLPAVWALSAAPGGTPGAGDTDFANGYEGWRFNYWALNEVGAAGAPVNVWDDADSDGMTNFAEYCFGRNPRVPDVSSLSQATVVNAGGTNYPAVTFTRRHLAVDVTWNVQESTDLSAWNSTAVLDSAQLLGNGLEQVTYRSTTAANDTPRFFRVVATK